MVADAAVEEKHAVIVRVNRCFDIVVDVSPSQTDGSAIINNATVGSDTNDPDTSNNSASESTLVVAITDLAIDKSDDGSDAVVGTDYTYTLKVTNNGPSTSTFTRKGGCSSARTAWMRW